MGNRILSFLFRGHGRAVRIFSKLLLRKARRFYRLHEYRLVPVSVVVILAANAAIYQNCAPANFSHEVSDASNLQTNIDLPPSDTTTTTMPQPPPTTTSTTTTTTTTTSQPPPTLPPPPPPPPSNIQVTIPNSNIDFGNVVLNTTSPAKSITISNQTPDDSVVLTLTTGGATQYFTIDQSSCAAGIDTNKSCTISFRFTAAALGLKDEIIQITAAKKSDPAKSTSVQFHLLGTGINDLAGNLSSSSLNFGNVVINTVSGAQSVTFTNKTPTDAVSISISQTNGTDFAVNSSTCANVAYNASCAIQVSFTPKSVGAQSSQVTLTIKKVNDPATPAITKTIDLAGTGITDLNVDVPASLDFGKIRLSSSQTKTLTITNHTPSDSVKITASLASADFTFDPNSVCLKSDLAPNASCTLTFSFTTVVTTAKSATANLAISKVSDASQSLNRSVALSGSGFVITPSSLDRLFLVGWYSRKLNYKVSYINRTADNTACPSIIQPPTGQDVNYSSGQQREFCFEPSGGHGIQLATSDAARDAAGNTMKDFILANAGFTAVPTLDQLFSSPADHTSDTAPMQEALFYYALGYLNIPKAQMADTSFDVKFNVHYVDDALALVVNNRFGGYWSNRETWGTNTVIDPVLNIEYNEYPGKIFPMSLRTGKDNSQTLDPSPWGAIPSYGYNNTFASNPLKEGANTVMAIWLDNNASQRNIVGAQIQYKGAITNGAYQNLPVFLPNVVQGYAYDSVTGNALAGLSVKIVDANTNGLIKTTTTDAQGFYRFEGILDGSRKVIFTRSGVDTASEAKTVNHNSASTAIVEINQGL